MLGITLLVFLEIVTWELTHLIMEKKLPKYPFLWKNGFFVQKIEFSKTSQVLQNCPFNLHDNCQKTMCSLKKCCLKFALLGNKKKFKPTFFSRKITVSSKNCFYQPLRSERNDLITCAITVQKPSKLLYVTFCELSCLRKRQKKAWVFLSLEE